MFSEDFGLSSLLIFDLDGTIADTKYSISEAVNITLAHFGKPVASPEDVERAMGNGALMLIRRLLPEADRENEELVRTVFEHYDRTYDQTCMNAPFYDGMKETMLELKRRGYKLAVLSNKQDKYVKKIIGEKFKETRLDFIQGQTELPVKPDIAGLKLIMDELSVSADECVFVGDSGVDIATARNANMDCIAVSWGFVGREGLEAKGAECVIDHPGELLSLIR